MQKEDDSIAPFEKWIRENIFRRNIVNPSGDDLDAVKLCSKPSMKAERFCRIKAFGNHYRVKDDRGETLDTYDCGVVCLHEWITEEGEVMKRYTVGEITDILRLDYGKLYTPIVLFKCSWVKDADNRGNPTYMRDRDGFLIVNFKHRERKDHDPFIFPEQCSQVFFSDERDRKGWKVVMRTESRSRRVMQEVQDEEIITTSVEAPGLKPPSIEHIPPPRGASSAMELTDEENRLAMSDLRECS